mgnify:CR=1 FL=1
MTIRSRSLLMAAAAATLLCLVPLAETGAKTANDRSYEYYEDALRLFGTKDYRGALIQLKNALQQDHRNLSARVLLGKTYLRLGDGTAAERQLTLARSTGADDTLVLIPYGRSLLLQGKHKKLLEEILPANRTPDIESEIRFLRGQAHLDQRQPVQARADFQDALKLRPDHPASLLGMARLMLSLGEAQEARRFAATAMKLAPKDADTWYVTGEILRTQGDYAGALTNYAGAIAVSDQHLPARVSRAAVLIDLHRYDDALEDVNYTLEILQRDPQTLYLYALILSQKKKHKEAGEALRMAAHAMDERDPDFVINHPPSLLLRGVINYSRRRFNDSYPLLSRYVDLVPHHVGARKLLGSLLLRRNEPAAAIKVLEPAARRAPSDGELLSLLGNAYMLDKQYPKATKAFEQAAEKQPETAALQTKLALSQLAVGDRKLALESLEKAIELNPAIGRADVLLGMIQIKSGDYTAAISAADKLAEKDPKSPFPHNLAGAALMRSGDLDKARTRFLKALEIAPAYAPAKYNLAALYLKEGKKAPARKLYEEILVRSKNDTRAMLELSAIAESEGKIVEAIKWLDQVKKRDSASIQPQLRLLSLYLRAGRTNDALLIANDLENRNPSNQDILEAKGRVLIAAGESARAVEIFRQASYLSANQPANFFRIAKYQIRLNDFEGARTSLKSAINLDPSYLPAHSALVNIEARLGGLDQALEIAHAVRAAYPKSPVGDLLTGDIMMRNKRYSDAVASYRTGLEKVQGPTLAVRLYQARFRLDDKNDALKDLEAWDKEHPGYGMVQRVLASAYLNSGQIARATEAHNAYVEKNPNDVQMINNLALLYQQKDGKRALELIERARKLAPSNPAVLDTYGWILVQQGDAAKGLQYLRQAQTRASDQIDVRFHIAVALTKLNRTDEAKRVLKDILTQEAKFQSRAEAEALYKTLK